MKGFTPFKRRPNQFNYTPRFYDPQKEERDRRRAELRGSRPEGEEEGDYVAGEYIRRQREARVSRREKRSKKGGSVSFLVIGAVVVFLVAYMLLPRIIGAFMQGGTNAEQVKEVDEFEEFNPYAPIRIVPNDYNGE